MTEDILFFSADQIGKPIHTDGVANGDPFECPYLRAWQCGLANYDHPCLFHVPNDPLWNRIRQSIQLEAQVQPG